MTPAGWASVAIFRMFAKALGKLCKRRDSHGMLRGGKRGGEAARAIENATLYLTDVTICNLTQ